MCYHVEITVKPRGAKKTVKGELIRKRALIERRMLNQIIVINKIINEMNI